MADVYKIIAKTNDISLLISWFNRALKSKDYDLARMISKRLIECESNQKIPS